MDKHFGTFLASRDFVKEDLIDKLIALMDFTIMAVKFTPERDLFEYFGECPLFDKLCPGEAVPEYKIIEHEQRTSDTKFPILSVTVERIEVKSK